METPYNENLLLVGRLRAERAVWRAAIRSRPASAIRSSSASSRGLVAGSSSTSGISTSTRTTATTSACCSTRRLRFRSRGITRSIDGFTGRVNLVEHKGFSAFVVMAHTNAIYSPPGVGGILLGAAGRRLPDRPRSEVQRDDEPAVRVREVTRGVGGAVLAVRLRSGRGRRGQPRRRAGADRRSADGHWILLRERIRVPGRAADRRRVHASNYGATRLRIPAEGTADDVNNPPRIAPRHLLDLGVWAWTTCCTPAGRKFACGSAC